jgi:hypothetical protein
MSFETARGWTNSCELRSKQTRRGVCSDDTPLRLTMIPSHWRFMQPPSRRRFRNSHRSGSPRSTWNSRQPRSVRPELFRPTTRRGSGIHVTYGPTRRLSQQSGVQYKLLSSKLSSNRFAFIVRPLIDLPHGKLCFDAIVLRLVSTATIPSTNKTPVDGSDTAVAANTTAELLPPPSLRT